MKPLILSIEVFRALTGTFYFHTHQTVLVHAGVRLAS